MLDGFFELISGLLNFYYELVPNYAIAIVLLTLTAMLVTTPLTMKSTRSMIEMQRLQPEIKRLQQQYKDDRQKQNEELMKFYKENQINPLGGCLPLLVQMPVFSILFWVVRGLINKANFAGLQQELENFGITPNVTGADGFKPRYLDRSTDLYQSLLGDTEMNSFGVDLSISPAQALQEGFVTALPYILAVMVIGGLSWFQSKQIAGRNKGAEVSPQQKMMTRIGPVMFVAIAFSMPAALGVYFLVSSTWRVGQQAYITHSLYRGEDSAGAQAQQAVAEVRAERDQKKKATSSSNGSKKAAADATSKGGSGEKTAGKAGSGAKAAGNGTSKTSSKNTSRTVAAGSGSKPRSQHPRSKKKKKRK